MKTYQIAICVDENFLMPSAVMLTSLFENNLNSKFQIHIFTQLDEFSLKGILRTIKKYEQFYQIHNIPGSDFNEFHVSKHISSTTYFRFIIPQYIKSHERCLYLDSDLVITAGIDDLYNCNLDGNIIGAVFHDNARDFNGGVLLIDIAKWNGQNISQQLFDWTRDNNEQIEYWDQDGLNAILGTKVSKLKRRWNQLNHMEEPGIVHFAGVHKPWQYHYNYSTRELFYKYLPKTDWKNFRLEEEKRIFWIRQGIKKFLNRTGIFSFTVYS